MATSTAAVTPSARIRDSLIELRELGSELLPADDLADLDDAIGRLDDVRCNVVLLGEFKRGKSTLINVLIEHAVLPTDVLPLTSAITVVRHGERPRLVVGYTSGDADERPFAELGRLVTAIDPSDRDDIVSVTVELPVPMLASGLQLVDTPGIGSIHAHNTTTTERFLGRVDVALCVLAADQPLNAPERELIATVVGAGARPLFAINKIDQIPTGDRPRTIAFVTEGLGDLAGADPEILAVSARSGEGIADLRAKLMALADAGLGDVIARSSGARGAGTARSVAQMARLEAAALRLPIDQLEARADELEQRVAELEQAHEDARDLLARGVDRALRMVVDEPLTGFARDHSEALEAELAQVAANVHGGARTLGAELDTWIDTRTREEFDALAPRYARSVGDELRMLEHRYAARVTEILDAVNAAAQAGLNVELAPLPIAAGVTRPAAFTFKLDDPEDTLERLVAAGRSLLPGAFGRELVLRAGRERLLAMIDRHAGRLRSALVERAREAARSYADQLDVAVAGACAAIRTGVARARERHGDEREPAERRVQHLADVEARCRGIAAELEEAAT